MFTLLQIELHKIYSRPRTYIAFAAITAIVLIFQFAFKYDGKSYMDLMLQNIQDNFEIDKSKAINGYFMCYIILNTLLVQVPILVALVAADTISGESKYGHLTSHAHKACKSHAAFTREICSLLYFYCIVF